MQKIKAVFVSDDQKYIEKFKNYILDSEYNNRISFEYYSDFEEMKVGVSNSKFSVLLTEIKPNDTFDTLIRNNFERQLFISDTINDENTIFKYQPLDDIMNTVLSIYYDTNGKLLTSRQERTTSTIAFSSATGGAGKTLLSLLLSKTLSKHSFKTFYLSLEELTSYEHYFKVNKEKSSEIFYYLKNEPHKLLSKTLNIKDVDKETGIEFFPINLDFNEISTLSTFDLENLVKNIAALNEYDFVIIDLDSNVNELNGEVLNLANEIFWILEPSETSFYKTKQVLDNNAFGTEIDIKKLHFVVNKYGENLFDGALNYNYNLEHKINFNQNWLDYNEREKLLEDSKIGKTLTGILNSISVDLEVDNER